MCSFNQLYLLSPRARTFKNTYFFSQFNECCKLQTLDGFSAKIKEKKVKGHVRGLGLATRFDRYANKHNNLLRGSAGWKVFACTYILYMYSPEMPGPSTVYL